jgi:hypothetical protein
MGEVNLSAWPPIRSTVLQRYFSISFSRMANT